VPGVYWRGNFLKRWKASSIWESQWKKKVTNLGLGSQNP
jgi:hypothetical protein